MMRKPLLAAALLLAGSQLASAQAQPSKIKTNSKPGKTATAADRTTAAAAAAPATDWSVTYAATITAEDLRRHLTVLASDEYEGRETGQKGQKMAAEYLAKQFAELGLTGPVPGAANAYLQPFTMNRLSVDPSTSVKIGSRTFVLNKDFYALADATFATATPVQPVFVGYGIKTDTYSYRDTAAAKVAVSAN